MKKKRSKQSRAVSLAALGKPPKKFCKKRSIGFFVCIGGAHRCHELLRGKATFGKDDIYIIPVPEAKLSGFHESLHESGEFHWVWKHGKEYTYPLLGREDNPSAFQEYLRRQKPICFCFRAGRKLTEKQIRLLVFRLIEFIPFDIDPTGICHDLEKKGFSRFSRWA